MKTLGTVSRQKTLFISAPDGLHLRPAALLANTARCFLSDITLHHGDFQADAKSIISLISLEAGYGAEVTLGVSGDDAEEALQNIADLFSRNFET